ncbi:Lupus La -like protein A [Trichinella sp. T8]|nr:Lupus La -like protein A [Trichinella sp. T8]
MEIFIRRVMKMQLLLFTVAAIWYLGKTTATPRPGRINASHQRHQIWAEKALELMYNFNCSSLPLLVDQCEQMRRQQSADVRVYVAEVTNRGEKLFATVSSSSSTLVAYSITQHFDWTHDGLLVLDPFPEASYGHLLLIYFIDYTNAETCEQNFGHYISGHGDCLRAARKRSCRGRYPWRGCSQEASFLCAMDILPTAFLINGKSRESRNSQLVHCKEIAGFAPCPDELTSIKMRHKQSRGHWYHEELQVGQEWAFQMPADKSDSTPQAAAPCRLFEVCDRAVILHGGWSELTTQEDDLYLLHQTGNFLKHHGFMPTHTHYYHPYHVSAIPDDFSLKNANMLHDWSAIRGHIQNLCKSSNCVDVLLVMIHGPAALHASPSLILGDFNHDGSGNPGEWYSMHDLLDDLANCHANQVHLILDHSFSGQVIELLNKSTKHKNVIAVSSSDAEQFSVGSEFTKLWLRKNQLPDCFTDSFHLVKNFVQNSSPQIFQGSEADRGKTLAGAPCQSNSAYSEQELLEKYSGCQNVPTALWFSKTKEKLTMQKDRYLSPRTTFSILNSFVQLAMTDIISNEMTSEVTEQEAEKANMSVSEDTSDPAPANNAVHDEKSEENGLAGNQAKDEIKQELPIEIVKAKIRKQMEYYFCNDNLCTDKFLRAEMEKDSGIPLETFMTFNRIKALTNDVAVVVAALKEAESDFLEVSKMTDDQLNIRRKLSFPVPDWDAFIASRAERTAVVKKFPLNVTLDKLEEFFHPLGKIESIRMIYKKDQSRSFTGTVFVIFSDVEEMKSFLTREGLSYEECKLTLHQLTVKKKQDEAEATAKVESTESTPVKNSRKRKENKVTRRKGVVLHVDNIPSRVNRHQLHALFSNYQPIEWIEFGRGDTKAKVRFQGDENAAQEVLTKIQSESDQFMLEENPLGLRLLTDAEEDDYWSSVMQAIEGKKSRAADTDGGTKRRGRRKQNSKTNDHQDHHIKEEEENKGNEVVVDVAAVADGQENDSMEVTNTSMEVNVTAEKDSMEIEESSVEVEGAEVAAAETNAMSA